MWCILPTISVLRDHFCFESTDIEEIRLKIIFESAIFTVGHLLTLNAFKDFVSGWSKTG